MNHQVNEKEKGVVNNDYEDDNFGDISYKYNTRL